MVAVGTGAVDKECVMGTQLLQGGEHGTAALPMDYKHKVVPGELGWGAAGT